MCVNVYAMPTKNIAVVGDTIAEHRVYFRVMRAK